ncbi:MAG TPA: glucoamylase family protein [Terriglobales bacterium]|nr:glucoamylase family protein [Terriglobales bacterium]
MPQNTHIELIENEAERVPQGAKETAPDFEHLRRNAEELSRLLAWNPSVQTSGFFMARWNAMSALLRPVLEKVTKDGRSESETDDHRWLRENTSLLWSHLWNTRNAFKLLTRLPHVRTPRGTTIPRAAGVAEAFLHAVDFEFSEAAFTAYLSAYQQSTVLKFGELWALIPSLELVLLEQIAVRGRKALDNPEQPQKVGICVRSVREMSQLHWKDALDSQIVFDKILREDPAGAYSRMDFDSRSLYRERVVKIAERSDSTEIEVAQTALGLARNAQKENFADPREARRQSHIGYYLIGSGSDELCARVAFRPSLGWRIRHFLVTHPDEFYLPGIEVLTFGIMSAIVLLLTSTNTSPGLILFSMLLLLLPSSQSAVQVMNYLTTALLRPETLPKLDFSKSIPDDCATLVAVPALLLSEKQVRRLVQDIEVRYLGNHDPNLHFALLTDLPDSAVPSNEDDPLVELCANLVKQLNEKYSSRGNGSFLLLHRHRVYNPHEKVWMGWERKRGKLLDLNRLLSGHYDSFPVKAGDLSILQQVRFVITLDADTEVPRGAAHRLIGTLAHPLNQAIIDPEKNVVVAGYGILQPRVRVSVQSASRSRLANIYSGQTGMDIYTHAVSDVYQDLYGEGIFAGKGIYEVSIMQHVLEHRFPQNALLSHDLIEGAYARAGLVTDIEVVEDYPSHYSAYNRRKHRWLRGDWQITSWLFSRVPDETGRKVANPISLVSQWKILDNLRRSLVEPATFLLFVLSWLVLPGSARNWTIAAICILFVPVWFEFLFNLVRAIFERKFSVARDALHTLFTANFNVFLSLVFLGHQMLVSMDAVVRTVVRRFFTRQRLLEWETAAEAELGGQKRTPVDMYLDWMPVIALCLAALVYFVRPLAIFSALPILVLWGSSKLVSMWLNRPPQLSRTEASEREKLFLRRAAIRTWRYFSEFSTHEHNWLIPDNVQEEPFQVAPRVSPTNVGLLLNARQVACEFGYVTVPEFVDLTAKTLNVLRNMPRYRGHLYNWYDTHTLKPLPPLFVSTVDSGNLVASLWTLQQGCLSLLEQPVLRQELSEGFLDHLRILTNLKALPRSLFEKIEEKADGNWARSLLRFPHRPLERMSNEEGAEAQKRDVQWFSSQALARLHQFRQVVVRFTPWMLLDFQDIKEDIKKDSTIGVPNENTPLKDLPEVLTKFAARLQKVIDNLPTADARRLPLERLLSMVSGARMDATRLNQEIQIVAESAGKLADEMEFGFMWSRRRKLLSIGFDAGEKILHDACYDLLASESRTASFIAIAKDEIPQETWFLLSRSHTVENGRAILLSWTGTMFEYMMPAIWMKTYPRTLLDRSQTGAVLTQQEFTTKKRIPWGISESSFATRDAAGNYGYHAFGVPQLAVFHGDVEALVISPYSTFLALNTSTKASLGNLRRMESDGWFGAYGFYESADFSASQDRIWRHDHELIRLWMAHHQGMSLLAIANFLTDGVVQSWFHSHPRVQATELILDEKPANMLVG